MKYNTLITTFIFFMSFVHVAKADTLPTVVTVPISNSYVPVGFDDNDRAQLAVGGIFRNSCFHVGPYAVKTDHKTMTVTVQQQAYYYNGHCLQILVPFTQVVDLGILPPGEWTVVDYATGAKIGQLPVTRGANPGPDDFLYAPVTDAYVVSDTVSKENILVLTGSFPDRCTTFDDVKVHYYKNTIVVQPIAKRTQDNCGSDPTRFVKTVRLMDDLRGLQFLHVRVLNGQALNRFVEFP